MKLKNNNIVVIIPIYKTILTENEKISLNQCLTILKNYPITFITYNTLETTEYIKICEKYSVQTNFIYFEKEFFNGISGYNSLMKDLNFYKTFSSYKYMLIYQLDAFVFKDELLYWASKGYDYIGAPWFSGHKPYPEGKPETCGNGGLSLRRIKWFIKVLSNKGYIETPLYFIANFLTEKKYSISRLIKDLRHCFSQKNKLSYFLQNGFVQEDGFFCLTFHKRTFTPIKKPDWKTAAAFSFEMSPSYLYNEINTLPFGCHAWEKYEYDDFWSKFIH